MAYDPTKNLKRTLVDFEKQNASGKMPDYRITKVGIPADLPYIRCVAKIGDNEYQTTVYRSNIPELGLGVGDVVHVTNREITLVSKAPYVPNYQI